MNTNSNFVQTCQTRLDLFKALYKRAPKDGNEFANFCEHVSKNSKSDNSRRLIR